jgi:transposase
MGKRPAGQEVLFYGFSLERHVPPDHLLRWIDRFVDLAAIREALRPFYSEVGRPSTNPELMIRMLLVGGCFEIRSERRLCDEVHLNLAYRWFCRLGLEGPVPDHSTFSKSRHGRFRDSDLLRQLFEATVGRCMAEGLVGGDGFAVDGSLIRADASRQHFGDDENGLAPDPSSRAVGKYLDGLDNAAFGAATPTPPSRVSLSDSPARYTSTHGGQAQFCYATNLLIDVAHAVIIDVEASTAVQQAEVIAAKRMIQGAHDGLGIWPRKLIADTGYGSAEMLAWLVHERGIEPHISVFGKSDRTDGTFSRSDFSYDGETDA